MSITSSRGNPAVAPTSPTSCSCANTTTGWCTGTAGPCRATPTRSSPSSAPPVGSWCRALRPSGPEGDGRVRRVRRLDWRGSEEPLGPRRRPGGLRTTARADPCATLAEVSQGRNRKLAAASRSGPAAGARLRPLHGRRQALLAPGRPAHPRPRGRGQGGAAQAPAGWGVGRFVLRWVVGAGPNHPSEVSKGQAWLFGAAVAPEAGGARR